MLDVVSIADSGGGGGTMFSPTRGSSSTAVVGTNCCVVVVMVVAEGDSSLMLSSIPKLWLFLCDIPAPPRGLDAAELGIDSDGWVAGAAMLCCCGSTEDRAVAAATPAPGTTVAAAAIASETGIEDTQCHVLLSWLYLEKSSPAGGSHVDSSVVEFQ